MHVLCDFTDTASVNSFGWMESLCNICFTNVNSKTKLEHFTLASHVNLATVENVKMIWPKSCSLCWKSSGNRERKNILVTKISMHWDQHRQWFTLYTKSNTSRALTFDLKWKKYFDSTNIANIVTWFIYITFYSSLPWVIIFSFTLVSPLS